MDPVIPQYIYMSSFFTASILKENHIFHSKSTKKYNLNI